MCCIGVTSQYFLIELTILSRLNWDETMQDSDAFLTRGKIHILSDTFTA